MARFKLSRHIAATPSNPSTARLSNFHATSAYFVCEYPAVYLSATYSAVQQDRQTTAAGGGTKTGDEPLV